MHSYSKETESGIEYISARAQAKMTSRLKKVSPLNSMGPPAESPGRLPIFPNPSVLFLFFFFFSSVFLKDYANLLGEHFELVCSFSNLSENV